jgi:hypothetical protein
MEEKFCNLHGPYPANLPACPYCQGKSIPQSPQLSMMDDAAPTAMPGGMGSRMGRGVSPEDQPTDAGFGMAGGGVVDQTDFAVHRGGIHDDESTQLGAVHVDAVTEIEDIGVGLLGILWVKNGRRRGQIFPIQEGTIIGRTQGTILLDDPKVSQMHAKFTVEDDQFVIWDFGSSNGTYVGGERIRAATPLKENDEIKIGDTVFVLKLLSDLEEYPRSKSRRKSPPRR